MLRCGRDFRNVLPGKKPYSSAAVVLSLPHTDMRLWVVAPQRPHPAHSLCNNVYRWSVKFGLILWTECLCPPLLIPKFVYWSPHLHCGGIQRWDPLGDNWNLLKSLTLAFMMGLVSLRELEETPELCLWHVRTQWRGSQKEALTRSQVGQHLDLGLLNLQIGEKLMFVVQGTQHMVLCYGSLS